MTYSSIKVTELCHNDIITLIDEGNGCSHPPFIEGFMMGLMDLFDFVEVAVKAFV